MAHEKRGREPYVIARSYGSLGNIGVCVEGTKGIRTDLALNRQGKVRAVCRPDFGPKIEGRFAENRPSNHLFV